MMSRFPQATGARRRRAFAAVTLAAALAAALAAPALAEGDNGQTSASGAVAEPDGYRMDDYRSPVPETLQGGTVLSTEEARALWAAGGAAFIDVLPRPPKPKLPPGTVFRQAPRDHIPGSIWLPDVGYGALSPEMTDYFRTNLEAATEGNRARPVVFYCLDDCWMSWNAARRAIEWGYTAVSWYPEGTDGWTFEDLPVERGEPVPRPGVDEKS